MPHSNLPQSSVPDRNHPWDDRQEAILPLIDSPVRRVRRVRRSKSDRMRYRNVPLLDRVQKYGSCSVGKIGSKSSDCAVRASIRSKATSRVLSVWIGEACSAVLACVGSQECNAAVLTWVRSTKNYILYARVHDGGSHNFRYEM